MGMHKGCRFAVIGLALVAGMLTGCAGGMYVWGRNNGYAPVAYRIDMEKQELGEEIKNLSKVEYDTTIYPFGDYGWYIVTRNNVYEYARRTEVCASWST